MDYTLTSIERIVVESVSRGKNDLPKISLDTGLNLKVSHNVLQTLVIRSIISFGKDGYTLNPHCPVEVIRFLNSNEAIKVEALELIEAMLLKEHTPTKLKKVFLSDKDKKVLSALLKNVDDFIGSLPKAPKDASTKNFEVVYWGHDTYENTISEIIRS